MVHFGKRCDVSSSASIETTKEEQILLQFINDYDVSLIAIGNGTASRETEQFIADLIQKHKLDVQFIIVNEAGASVYSASEVARSEFPDFQVEEVLSLLDVVCKIL